MATKPEIIAKLQAAGIEHDPTATIPVLKALLPANTATPAAPGDSTTSTPTNPVAPAPKVNAERQARWDAFLAKAATQNATFELQKARGEFDVIPDSFI